MLYFAYGMNTNTQGMARRCPGAVAFGRARLLGHRFRFAGPADVQVDRRYFVDGVLWDITEDCLKSLDVLEGYPYFYERKWAQVEHNQGECSALVYYMQPGHRNSPPSSGYFNMVNEGYEEFGVPTRQLWQNVTQSTTFLPY
jgi:gamma-glutamylcyclotransferase (GGCT)/AIG2-like uncharacterized protein YtfP